MGNQFKTNHRFHRAKPSRPSGPRPPPSRPSNNANPTIHNYYSALNHKIMPSMMFNEKGIWIIHLFTSTPYKCPQCGGFKKTFIELAKKLSDLVSVN